MPDAVAKKKIVTARHFTVALADRRDSKKWTNTEITWDAIVERCSNPIITCETTEEYFTWKRSEDRKLKAKADRAKDVGGFVGGSSVDGSRQKTSINPRSLITLDLDYVGAMYADVDRMLNDLEGALTCTWFVYSTHSHTPGNPRLRLVIPLAEDIPADEYEPIARKIAEDVGMEMFDPTTFQINRLMYWSSCSCDAKDNFVFHLNAGAYWLDPQRILDRYGTNGEIGMWRDASQWPTHPDDVGITELGEKDPPQPPTDKYGPVGTFCRAVDPLGGVRYVIETLLAGKYEPAENGRYNWLAGTGVNGLAVLSDKDGRPDQFVRAYDATDPLNDGHLKNAFDILRTHMFGDLDVNVKEETPPEKYPSYKAAVKYIKDLEIYKEQRLEDKTAEMKDRFGIDYDGSVEVPDVVVEPIKETEEPVQKEKTKKSKKKKNWASQLLFTNNGDLAKCDTNLYLIVENDPALVGHIRRNSFSGRTEKFGGLPWDAEDGTWKNSDTKELGVYITKEYQVDFSDSSLGRAKTHIENKNSYHPLLDYFDSIVWDGIPRAETIVIDYLNADDTPYTRAVTRKWLLGAVMRVLHPGIKFDNCLSLTGDQGIGKSTLAAKLGGDYFSDALTFDDMRDKKTAGEKLKGAWILEIGEMKGLRKTDVESVKSFLSQREDNYRPAYGADTETYPRSCVFIGTGNNSDFLTDPSGNRRFWPVRCKRTTGDSGPHAWDITDETRDQIWAEVLNWAATDESLELPNEVRSELAEKQRAATVQDARIGVVTEYLAQPIPLDWHDRSIDDRILWFDNNGAEGHDEPVMDRDFVNAMEIWCVCFKKQRGDLHTKDSREIGDMLAQCGYTKGEKRRDGKDIGPQYPYYASSYCSGTEL